MDRRTLGVLLISAFLLTAMLTLSLRVSLERPVSVDTIHMDMTVGDAIGFNIDTDALHFATVRPGSAVVKRIILNSESPMNAELRVSGDITRFIRLPRERIMLIPHRNETVEVVLKVPPDEHEGSYNGTLHVLYREGLEW